MQTVKKTEDRWVPTICRLCLEGVCLIRVHIVDGVAVDIEGNRAGQGFTEFSKNRGSVCPKPFSMIQKLYNPHRIKNPLKRNNSIKGRGVDPKWVEISWDEALGTIAEKLKKIRLSDPTRLSVAPPGAQIHTNSGTWPAFVSSFGKTPDLGGGGSMHCRQGEHILGNLIHGAYRCQPDLSHCNYLLNLGDNTSASGGAPEAQLYSDARARGMKTVVVDPVFSLTAAKADEWLPIRPGTDTAFLLALIYVVLRELNIYDAEFLKTLTNSPYLVDTSGYFLRDKSSGKVLVWDQVDKKAKAFDDTNIRDFALEGTYVINGTEARPAFQVLKDHVREYTPEWASKITDIDAGIIRRIAKEFVDNAMIGSTIRLQDVTLPLRPVAIKLGRGVSVMHSYQSALATHILQALVGSIEVVGGHGGGMANMYGYWRGVNPGTDGMLKIDSYSFTWPPVSYDGVETLVPYGKVYNGMHMRHLAYRNLVEPAKNFPMPPAPEALLRYRCNPLLSIGEPVVVAKALSHIPFIISISYVIDEMTEMADIVLPEHLELERYELTAYASNSTAKKYPGIFFRQPIVHPLHNTMEISDIFTELADRIGFLGEYNSAINVSLALVGPYKLDPGRKYSWVEIVERHCKSVTGGAHDLEWFKENCAVVRPVSAEEQYDVHLKMLSCKMRYPLPYMEHVKKTGVRLARALSKVGIDWWPTNEYVPLPIWVPSVTEETDPEYDFYVTTCRSTQFAFGSNVDCPWPNDISENLLGESNILMNIKAAKKKGIRDGDEVWVESEVGKVKQKVKLVEGIRPDTLLIPGQFGQWSTPVARDKGRVSMVTLLPVRHSWTDHVVGCMQGHTVKCKIYKA